MEDDLYECPSCGITYSGPIPNCMCDDDDYLETAFENAIMEAVYDDE